MELHVIMPRGAVLVALVVDGKLVLPPDPPPGAAPDQPAPGK